MTFYDEIAENKSTFQNVVKLYVPGIKTGEISLAFRTDITTAIAVITSPGTTTPGITTILISVVITTIGRVTLLLLVTQMRWDVPAAAVATLQVQTSKLKGKKCFRLLITNPFRTFSFYLSLFLENRTIVVSN